MLNVQQRNTIRTAQEEASITIQVWLAARVRDADHGDDESLEQLKLFLKVYRKTGSPRQGYGAVMLKANQLELGEA